MVYTTPEECQFNGWYWNFAGNYCQGTPVCNEAERNDCLQMWSYTWNSDTCTCECNNVCQGSPVLVDVEGDGFRLTDNPGGVVFDLRNDGRPMRWSWTTAGATTRGSP